MHGGYVARSACGLLIACSSLTANATDFEVRQPTIDVHEFEYDLKAARGVSGSIHSGTSMVHEFEFGVNEWWSPAIEGEWTRDGTGAPAGFQAVSFESRFQFPASKQSWWNIGLLAEYEHGKSGNPSAARLGPAIQLNVASTVNLLNLVAVKESGPGARRKVDAAYAWQTRWILSEEFQPGIEYYGGAMEAGSGSPRQNAGGPVFFGVFDLGGQDDIRYEVGYLHDFGGSGRAGTFKLLIGYEHRF